MSEVALEDVKADLRESGVSTGRNAVTQALNELCKAAEEIIHVAGTWLAFEVVK